ESPGPVILAHESLAPGIRPARRLKDAVIAERRHDRVEVVAVEGISDPGRSRPTLAIDLLCRSTRAESQSNDPAVGKRVETRLANRWDLPAGEPIYLPREVFFGRLGLAGVFFSVWACDFGRFFPATRAPFRCSSLAHPSERGRCPARFPYLGPR